MSLLTLLLINFNFCSSTPTYESFTTVTQVSVTAGSSLAFFNDRGMPFFAAADKATKAEFSWQTPRPTDPLAKILPLYTTVTERADLATLDFGTSIDYVSHFKTNES
jgi:hypothetical protein